LIGKKQGPRLEKNEKSGNQALMAQLGATKTLGVSNPCESTCWAAAKGGNLEVLQWLHQNGCPWNEDTWKYARRICRPYLIEYGCPGAR
jgi:hypothetical protein